MPHIKDAEKSRSAGISLPPSVIAESRHYARTQGMTLSFLVKQLLMKELERMGRLPKVR